MSAELQLPRTAVAELRQRPELRVALSELHTGVILGSGLGGPADAAVASGGLALSYADIPEMPQSAVPGHAGRLVFGAGQFSGIVFLQGRVHHYEGHSLSRVLFGAHLLRALGIRKLIVTNAAGGIRADLGVGDLMLIDGHWTFLNVQATAAPAVRGSADGLWSQRMRKAALAIPTSLRIHQGTYAMMSGPCYETPAEVRMLQRLGVDAVGMSTIPEALDAARNGVEVIGISCITNVASGLSDVPPDHSDVSSVAGSINDEFSSWLAALLKRCSDADAVH